MSIQLELNVIYFSNTSQYSEFSASFCFGIQNNNENNKVDDSGNLKKKKKIHLENDSKKTT